MSSTVSIEYNYPFASSLLREAKATCRLQLATSGGVEKNPYFFQGRFLSPKQSADLLLVLSTISRTRFFSPGELQARMVAAADPVVTSDGRQLRFEVFSLCCGAYARFDLHGCGIDGKFMGKGSTNVDFNPPMRAALTSVVNSEPLALKIGSDLIELERKDQSVVERKVKLPVRWLKGFVEVQIYQSILKQMLELSGLELAKAIHTLPPQNIMQAGTLTYLVPSAKSFRLSQRAAKGAVAVGAISRLKVLEPILRYAKTVRVYSNDEAISAFELVLSEGSFFLVLSPNAARGFSGEGQALTGLTRKCSDEILARVKSALKWQDKINPTELTSLLGLELESVTSALQILGSRGLVGFDLESATYFHRELPFDLALVEELHPRMIKAREIFKQKFVRLNPENNGTIDAHVKGRTGEHFVQISADSSRCTCDWFAKNQGQRGPCSHILAVEIAITETNRDI